MSKQPIIINIENLIGNLTVTVQSNADNAEVNRTTYQAVTAALLSAVRDFELPSVSPSEQQHHSPYADQAVVGREGHSNEP